MIKLGSNAVPIRRINMAKKKSSVDKELDNFEKSRSGEENAVPKIVFTAHDLVKIQPKTENQHNFCNFYDHKYTSTEGDVRDTNLMCIGSPGTGKTFLSIAKALDEVVNLKEKEKIIIIRSVVETRQRGFLPGTEEEKEAPFELPYIGICDELIKYKWRNYERLKKAGIIQFESTSNLRGTTLNDAIVIVDECQNLNLHELDTVITRLGQNSRVIFCGDYAQSDLLYTKNDSSGLLEFLKVVNRMPSFKTVKFNVNDIVRSGLVKEYILAKNSVEVEELEKIRLKKESQEQN